MVNLIEPDRYNATILEFLAGADGRVNSGDYIALNAVWHTRHRLPKRATMAERVRWHIAHAKHCGCRPIPPSVQAAPRKVRAGRKGSPRRVE